MARTLLDNLEEHYADAVLVKGLQPHRAVVSMVASFPDATGLDYTLVLCSAAAVFEFEAGKQSSISFPNYVIIYKIIAMLGLDILVLQKSHIMVPTGRDLVEYWRQIDDQLFGPRS